MATFANFGVSRPIDSLVAAMRALARGRLDVVIPCQARKDELGQMAGALTVFKENAEEKLRLESVAAADRDARDDERQKASAEKTRSAEREAARQSEIASEREELAKAQSLAIERVGEALSQLAARDMAQRITEPLPDAYEALRANFNEAVSALAAAFQQVRAAALIVTQGTQEIVATSGDLAARTEQQAASIEQSTSAVDGIRNSVTTTAARTRDASEFVAGVRADAVNGSEIAEKATQAMQRIEASSREMSEIIDVIDSIAFQTNLLALNAGVEAARAGESGRGFAVVASEVRILAKKSAEAARQIASLIHASRTEVQEGVRLVADSRGQLETIGSKVTEMARVVAAIADDAQAQASGIAEVNTSIRQIDEITRQNAAMADEATEASRMIAQESQKLSDLMAEFVLDARQGSAPALRRGGPVVATAPRLRSRSAG
jgi:methyl-accepting chemotaxis protein